MHKYPTNLTDKQWQVIKNMLDPKERFRKYSLRSVFDGILYIVKTGVQWRMLPSEALESSIQGVSGPPITLTVKGV